LLSSCSSSNSSWHLLAPATWFSHAPADKVDKAEAKVDENKEKARKEAQKALIQGTTSLSLLPRTDRPRPVAVATDFLRTAETLLNQTEGAVPSSELDGLRQRVIDLNSENKEVRDKAEKDTKKSNEQIGLISKQLQDSEGALNKANGKLRDAFDRENALANQLRYYQSLGWIAAGIAILAILAALYVKIAVGGIPRALGSSIARIRQINAPAGDLLTSILDSNLNRHEQALIAQHVQKLS